MARLTVRVLGCGDAFASGGRLQSCFLLERADTRILIDCGATALVAMRRLGVDPATIDAIVLSHLHGDHFGGVPYLLLEAQYVGRRGRPLIVAGPPGTAERVLGALDVLFPGAAGVEWRYALSFRDLVAGRTETIAGATIAPYEVHHPSGSAAFAFRVELAGRTVAYSGDTEWTDALLAVAGGADLMLCECYAYQEKKRFHLDYQTLRAKRPALDAARLVLTHLGPDMLAHRGQIDCEVAEDGQLIELEE